MDERQAYTFIPCPCTSLPVVPLPCGNRHYANLFADNVSRKHKKQEEAAPTAAVATFSDLRGVKGRGLQWAGGVALHGKNSW